MKRGTLYVLQGSTFSRSDCCGVGKQVEQTNSGVSSEWVKSTSRSLSVANTLVASRVSVEHHRVAQGCPERTTVWVPSERYDNGEELAHVFLVVEEFGSHVSFIVGAETIQWQTVIGEEISSLRGSEDHRKGLLSTTSGEEGCMTCISHASRIESRHTLVYTNSVSSSYSLHMIDVVSSEISTVSGEYYAGGGPMVVGLAN
ncbi:hypothetical protein LIER_13811 [Lithospermum erythrorhizon]|uniref:Uncharacterized protein n=1 Tax=Lithospermum erythrorhizon TaxID=34254 RepID=A0AAV3Q217_LITER